MSFGARLALAVATAGVALTAASNVVAQEEDEPAPPEHGWRYEIDPYAWIPVSLKGDATVRDRDFRVDANFGDLMQNFDLGAMARFEAWSGRFGLIVDGTFLKTGNSGNLPGPLATPFDWTSRLLLGDFLIGARPIVARLGAQARLSVELDLGVRVAWLDANSTIGGTNVSADAAFGRGIVGARVPLRLSRLWGVGIRGSMAVPDVGWASLAWLEIDPTDWLGLTFAYRVEHVDLSGDRVAMSATAQGPYIGLGFRFGSGSIY